VVQDVVENIEAGVAQVCHLDLLDLILRLTLVSLTPAHGREHIRAH